MKSSMSNSKTGNPIKKSMRVKAWLDDLISSNMNPRKKERDNYSKALHFTVREFQEKIKELTSENASLKDEKLSIFDYLHKEGLSPKEALQNDMSTVKDVSTEIPEKSCEFKVFVDRNPNCGNPDAPISPYLKRHLNGQICALCLKLKKKALGEVKRKQDEEIKRFHEKTRKEASFYQNRIEDTLQQQKTHRRTEPFTNAHGHRITP